MTRARPVRAVALAALAALSLLGSACGSSSSEGGTGTATGTSPTGTTASGPLTVFAAASLQESFTTIGTAFEAANPGTTVTFSFGPSSGLAQSIAGGAPVDVFASASTATMDTVVAAGAADDPQPFAANTMEIAVPPDDPAGITGVADLARPGVKVALCQAQVPCGATAAQVFANAGLSVTPVTQEADVKAVLTKVRLGEVDAGMVYATDVRAAGAQVTGVAIPAEVNASTTYPIAALRDAPNPTAARAFVAYVRSPAGQQVLQGAGFSAP